MTGQQIAARFGQDAPTRISTSASMLQESSSYMPGEPYVPALIPFQLPVAVPVIDPGYTIVDGHKVWTSYPARTDISFYQGDDVVIPVWLSNDEMDMTEAANWEWHCQIRDYHSYLAPLTHDLTCVAEFIAADPADPATLDTVYVEATLLRADNLVTGLFGWELYSISTPDTDFPDGFLRTWLYGICKVVRRGSTTDYLPSEVITPPIGWVQTAGGWLVGPNGRVP